MRGSVHAIIGGAVGVVLATVLHTPTIPLAIAGALGGLLPDMDHPHIAIGRYMPWPKHAA